MSQRARMSFVNVNSAHVLSNSWFQFLPLPNLLLLLLPRKWLLLVLLILLRFLLASTILHTTAVPLLATISTTASTTPTLRLPLTRLTNTATATCNCCSGDNPVAAVVLFVSGRFPCHRLPRLLPP